jgi:hypothetical protein
VVGCNGGGISINPRKFCQVDDRFQFGLPKGLKKIGLA